MNYLIIAGGRDFNDTELAFDSIHRKVQELGGFSNVTIIEGGARGADRIGFCYAITMGIETQRFEADWGKHGRSAGPIRNNEMANAGTHLLAFWNGKSKGTKHMIEVARKKGLDVEVISYSN